MTHHTTTVTFTDAAFRRSAGRKPRGWAAWAFQATQSRAAFDADLFGPVVIISGTFTEATAEAARRFTGTPVVAVLP